MENTNNYSLPVNEIPREREGDEFSLSPSESAFFWQMEKSLKKYAADMSAPKPLETLHENLHRLHRLFIILGHPWLADSGMIQKACAWYLAYAKPTKQEAGRLIKTLNGFTLSAGYITEWSELVNRMREFFCIQEKELKRLFEYEREMEEKHKVRQERLSAEGVTYSMTIGKGEIYGMIYPQIEKLHGVMGQFIEREKAPFECKVKSHDEYCIRIGKDVDLQAGKDEFHVSYSLDTLEGSMYCMSAGQMRRIADAISGFLEVYGEDRDKKACRDMTDCPVESLPGIMFEIKQDGRQPVFRTVPWISKCVRQEEEGTGIGYFIDVNEMHSLELSFSEFVAIYRRLGDFLKKSNEVR